MKKLVVDASIEWIDRQSVKTTDSLICVSSRANYTCTCTYKNGEWVVSGQSGEVIARAKVFTDFFKSDWFKGWKFYVIDRKED